VFKVAVVIPAAHAACPTDVSAAKGWDWLQFPREKLAQQSIGMYEQVPKVELQIGVTQGSPLLQSWLVVHAQLAVLV
jgi:hypothetical protein